MICKGGGASYLVDKGGDKANVKVGSSEVEPEGGRDDVMTLTCARDRMHLGISIAATVRPHLIASHPRQSVSRHPCMRPHIHLPEAWGLPQG